MLLDRVTHITIHIAQSLEYYITANGHRIVESPTSSYISRYEGFLVNIDELLPIVSPSHPRDITVTITRTHVYPPTIGNAEHIVTCCGTTLWTRHRALPADTALAILCNECIHPICSLLQVRKIDITNPFLEEPIVIQAITSAQSVVRLSVETLPTAILGPHVPCNAPFQAIVVRGCITATSQLAFLSTISKTTTHLSIAMTAACLSAPPVFPSVQHLAVFVELDTTTPTQEEVAAVLSVTFPSLTAICVAIFNAPRPSYSAHYLALCLADVYPRTFINCARYEHSLTSPEDLDADAEYVAYANTPENQHTISHDRPLPTTPFSPATAVLRSHCDSVFHRKLSCDTTSCPHVLGVRLAAFSLAVARVAPLLDPLVVLPIFSHLHTRRDKFKSFAHIHHL
jgi:hypothetical protein